MELEPVRMCFVEDFYFGEPALLFWGSEEGLQQMVSLFQSIGSGNMQEIPLEDIGWIEPLRGTRVEIRVADTGRGLIGVPRKSTEFVWSFPRQRALEFADKVQSVAASPSASHHYLDSDEDQYTVVVSKGEYDDLHLALGEDAPTR